MSRKTYKQLWRSHCKCTHPKGDHWRSSEQCLRNKCKCLKFNEILDGHVKYQRQAKHLWKHPEQIQGLEPEQMTLLELEAQRVEKYRQQEYYNVKKRFNLSRKHRAELAKKMSHARGCLHRFIKQVEYMQSILGLKDKDVS